MDARRSGSGRSPGGRTRWLVVLLLAAAAALCVGPIVREPGGRDPRGARPSTRPDRGAREPVRPAAPLDEGGSDSAAFAQAAKEDPDPQPPAAAPADGTTDPGVGRSSPWFDEKAREEFVDSVAAADRPYVLDLRGRSLLPGRADAIRFRGPVKRIYLQLADLPRDAERAELRRLGVELLEYVGSFTYVARVEEASFGAVRALSWLRGVAEVEPRDKLSDTLARGLPAEWAVAADGVVALTVRCHPDVSLAEASKALVAGGAEVLSTSWLHDQRLEARAPATALAALAAVDGVAHLAETAPPREGTNLTAAALSNADDLWGAPYGLSGTGVRVGIWDGGAVDAAHAEFGGRVTLVESGSASAHATHVAGTIGAAGVSPSAHGMAAAALLYSWDYYGDIASEQSSGRAAYGLSITNNSWGYVTDSSYYGKYTAYARELDALMHGTGLLVVKAAGNSGSGYDTIDTASAAKHVIVVGALSDAGAVASFSSRGPCDDGRVKPDVSANGVGLFSPVPGGGYASYSGTSMATPTTAGCLALIVQRHRAIHGSDPGPAMARALLCHTARDAGAAGPDYLYGYGIVDARAAVDLLDDDATPASRRIWSGTLAHLGQDDHAVSVSAGTPALKVTLAWVDPPGSTSAAKALVNDLDLLLVAPDGSPRFPWRLNPASPSAPALSDAPNTVDVVEQVVVASPAAGTWILRVRGAAVASGTQPYVLLVDGGSAAASTRSVSGTITGDPGRIGGVDVVLSGAAHGLATSAADGSYSFSGLGDGAYTLTPSRAGVQFAPASREVTIAGGDVTGQDFAASAPAVTEYVKDEIPDRAIPDGKSHLSSTLVVPDGGTVASLRVYVDIRHPWRGDLRILLISPAGQSVVLHDRTGGSADDLVGWYDTELAPAQSLGAFAGVSTAGTWTLRVQDRKRKDAGKLHLWKLEIAR